MQLPLNPQQTCSVEDCASKKMINEAVAFVYRKRLAPLLKIVRQLIYNMSKTTRSTPAGKAVSREACVSSAPSLFGPSSPMLILWSN